MEKIDEEYMSQLANLYIDQQDVGNPWENDPISNDHNFDPSGVVEIHSSQRNRRQPRIFIWGFEFQFLPNFNLSFCLYFFPFSCNRHEMGYIFNHALSKLSNFSFFTGTLLLGLLCNIINFSQTAVLCSLFCFCPVS